MFPSVLGKTWASPTTMVGLLLGALGLMLGGTRPRLRNNALEFCGNRLIAPFTSAVTIGHVICYASRDPDPRIQLHELQHTYQAELLGPLYLPLHIAFQLAAFVYSFFDRSRRYASVNDRVHSRANLLETGPMASPPRAWPTAGSRGRGSRATRS
jgi:hypothetical protein